MVQSIRLPGSTGIAKLFGAACAASGEMTTETPLITLASASPRRRELLASIWPRYRVRPSPLAEPSRRPHGVSAHAWCDALAYFKARSVADVLPPDAQHWVLGADTIVVCDGKLLGKPRDLADARRMLELQAGRASEVITGVALLFGASAAERRLFAISTSVWMKRNPAAIDAYLASGDWEGKAGAYGIQNVRDELVERIEGSFSNVVGLPLESLQQMLHELPATVREMKLASAALREPA
jgi:septum formation protein